MEKQKRCQAGHSIRIIKRTWQTRKLGAILSHSEEAAICDHCGKKIKVFVTPVGGANA